MSTVKEKNDLPETVECPHCGREIKTLHVVNKGFIRGRPQSVGGPYYQTKCIFCHEDFDCFFETEIFTRKPSVKKAFIFQLSRANSFWSFIGLILGRALKGCRGSPRQGFGTRRNRSRQKITGSPGREAERDVSLPIIFKVHPELLTAFRTLGVDPDTTVSRIKKHYKNLVKRLHPDKINHLRPDEREEATKKLIEINKAYGTIKELFM